MQASLTALWGNTKRKQPPTESKPDQEPKRLKTFQPGGAGAKVDDQTRDRFKAKLGPLDAIATIRRRSKKRGKAVALKPMHQSILDIKLQNMDTLLLVEEGYKYKVYADDATIVSKILGFFQSDGRRHFESGYPGEDEYENFSTCSFPVKSIQTHTKKLVDMGYKVGLVQQMEQAALKASGKLMKRKLTRKYTKATFSDEFETGVEFAPAGSNSLNYLFALREEGNKIGIVAVEPATGDIVYDEFVDGIMMTELETRLLHIRPSEILYVGQVSSRVLKLVSNISQSRDNDHQTIVHNQETDSQFKTGLINHFADVMEVGTGDEMKQQISKTLDMVQSLGSVVQQALYSLIIHLTEFQMSGIFNLIKNYHTFSSQSEMYLSGDTLVSLEIFQNQHDQTGEGSLFELFDQTRTPFGRRLLRKWVAKPLLKQTEIEKRLAAVTELTKPIRRAGMVAEQLRYCLDLEKALANVYYQRSSRPQLYKMMKKLEKIVLIEEPTKFESEYLNELFGELPKHRKTVIELCQLIDDRWGEEYEKEKKQDIIELFLNTDNMPDEEIIMRRFTLHETETELKNYLKEVKRQLQIPVCFGTHMEQVYLIEIDAKHKHRIPNDWTPISKGASKHKYQSPQGEKLVTQFEKHKSLLQEECARAYQEYLGQIAQHYDKLRDLISALAQIDSIMALSELARYGHYCCPTFVEQAGISVTEGRHPTAEHAKIDDDYIANGIEIGSESRVKIVTGPNMGGKSSYVRQVALIAIMAQIGSYVPADAAQVGPFDAVYTRMGAYDNMIRGQSTFKVELQECGVIMNKATSRSLVILDEVGRGTSTIDGHSIAHAVLSYFITDIQCATLFITHYPALAHFATEYPQVVGCYRMGFEQLDSENVRFTYKVEPGIAQRSHGLNVARIAGLPQTVLDGAQVKSRQLEAVNDESDDSKLVNFVKRAIKGCISKSELAQVVK